MQTSRFKHAFVAVMIMLAMLAQGTWALAGTTGGITGVLTDSTTGKPVADAQISAISPSQSANSTTDAGGHFSFLALAPDTYTVSATKEHYAPVSTAGVTVFADQSVTLTMTTHAIEPKTIARVTSRAAGNLVKPGTTSDVYSVNAATQQVVSGSGGGFNLDNAYSGVYSQPGVTSYVGNAGWGQVFYIRGASYGQTGYEFDGVPINRAFDNYNAGALSNLGQQELQVYTGGSPSGASSATLGGFINQVIKTGTYPGFGTLTGGIGSPGFYHALTAEAGGANPARTFSYYVGLRGYNQHFPAGSWSNLSNISSDGMNRYGIASGSMIANEYGALCGAACGLPACAINVACPDAGNWASFMTNGPWSSCQSSGANAGEPIGYTAAAPGPFNGACLGYYPFNTSLSDMFERDNVLNFHFAIPHKRDSGRDDLQLLWDNSFQMQLNGDSINDAGGLPLLNAYLTPWAPYTSGFPGADGVCGYENFFGLGCATSGGSPIPYVDSKIFAPGTQFGQSASSATAVAYYFPNSPTNRSLNTPFGPSVGEPANLKDGFNNDVGIIKAQYTKNIGSNAYARLFGYTFYSDWLIGGQPAGGVCYIDGLLCGIGGPGVQGTADYELATHTRGAEFQFADQINPQNLLRFTGNYTTAGVTRFNNGSFLNGYLGSRSGVTDWTNGNPSNPVCYDWTSAGNFGNPGNCDGSSARAGFFSGPKSYAGFAGTGGVAPADLAAMCANPAYSARPGCVSFLAGGSNWLVTTPGGQGTFNSVKPIFASASLEDEFKPNDKWDLNLGVRFESYRYDLRNSNTPEMNFWFNAYAQTLCYDPATGQPMFTPLAPGQPIPPNPVSTSPLGACGMAPSGQEGLHPTGGTSVCSANPGAVDCGSLAYTANGPSSFTHTLVSPRIGGTYTMDPDDVLRFTVGKYTQPTSTAFEQYLDQSGKRAANFDFSRFWGLGFNTPAHDNPVQYSNNYDFSWEHHFRNTDITAKVSPFYRDTHNQTVTVVLGPGFVSGVNVGHQHSYGVELAISKGDPTRNGWSGGLSYTYTKALIQYGDLANGTNAIDYLNNYVKAFNGLTQAGGGSPCYDTSTTPATPVACPASFAGNPTIIQNPYYTMSQQSLMDRSGWYPTYPNQPPNDPLDQGGTGTAISPNMFAGWLQFKQGRWSIAPNFELIQGSYYGSPTDTYGIDPRACAQNQGAATTPAGTAVPVPAADAGFCDFLTAGASPYVQSGYLAIPNPYNGKMDTMGQYQEPWEFNVGALIRYDISPKVTANLTLTNLYNGCFGGSKTAWSSAFAPGRYVCGYSSSNGSFVGTQPGAGFFYGASPTDAANGSANYPSFMNYPYAPFTNALPFQAYLQLQVKI